MSGTNSNLLRAKLSEKMRCWSRAFSALANTSCVARFGGNALASINSNAKHDVVYADNYPTLLLHEPGAQVCDARKAATAIICRAPPAFLKQIMQPFRLHYFLCLVVVADLIENKSHVATAGMHFNRNTATIEFAVNRIIVNRSAEIFKHVCFMLLPLRSRSRPLPAGN